MNNNMTIIISVTEERLCLPQALAFLFLPMSLFLVLTLASAQPYIPQRKTHVLDTLPTNFISLFRNNESGVERNIVGNDQWEGIQQELVVSYLSQAKASGDMRYISYAQNRLKHWLQELPQSEMARLLDAKITQYNHDFKGAIQSLDALTKHNPKNIEAWSLLSNLQLLTGDFTAAKLSCKQLSARSTLIDTVVCQSNIMIREGGQDEAGRMLKALLPMINNFSVKRQIWFYTSLAEINIQSARYDQADNYISQAMKLVSDNDLSDNYLTRIYADYLVHNNKLKKAFNLIKDIKNDSSMMIRSAVIAKNMGDTKTFEVNKTALIQIFDIEKRRGLARHLREQALFTLLIMENPVVAFNLAQKNWSLQKEPEDARILLKAALLLGNEVQLQQTIVEINKTGLVDQRLEINRLRESII